MPRGFGRGSWRLGYWGWRSLYPFPRGWSSPYVPYYLLGIPGYPLYYGTRFPYPYYGY